MPDCVKHIDRRDDLVEFLEELKREVISGEVTDVALASVTSDGEMRTGWMGTTSGNNLILLGAVHYLGHRMAVGDI